jgi:hypothetical protein
MFSHSNRYLAARQTSVFDAVGKSLAFLLGQQTPRSPYNSYTLAPNDASFGRSSTGTWAGTFNANTNQHPDLSPTPIQLLGPMFFPITPGEPVLFTGVVDAPFASMEGWQGLRFMEDPLNPGSYIPDPDTVYSDGGTNWGAFFVLGSRNGTTQFITKIGSDRHWEAEVSNPSAGSWSFQVVTYENETDADSDTNRILVGLPWSEADRPGDIQNYYCQTYQLNPVPQFSDVILTGEGPTKVKGRLEAWSPDPSKSYWILITNETDMEYCWAIEPAVLGYFEFVRAQAFGGEIKLRLIECDNDCPIRQVGRVWCQQNESQPFGYPDLRIEYRAITDSIPVQATSTSVPTLTGTWSVTHTQHAIGRVNLLNLNTKRVLGQTTMPSGLLRSFNTKAEEMGQSPAGAYYDSFRDRCYLYDQAIALISFIQTGNQDAAVKLVDALLQLQNADGSFQCDVQQEILFDEDTTVIRNRTNAWICYALLLADRTEYRSWWLERTNTAAQDCLDYILGDLNTINLVKGGKGTVDEPDTPLTWWAAEDNAVIWWCLDEADALYGSLGVDYREHADNIRTSLTTYGWDQSKGTFRQGGDEDYVNDARVLSIHTWGASLLSKWDYVPDALNSLERATAEYFIQDFGKMTGGFTTFSFEGEAPGTVRTIWPEGSFAALSAYRTVDPQLASGLTMNLVKTQDPSGGYPVVLQEDPVNSIQPWISVIGAGWSILAYSGIGTVYENILWDRPAANVASLQDLADEIADIVDNGPWGSPP